MNIASGGDIDLLYVGYINRYDDLVPKEVLYPIKKFIDNSELKNEIPDYVLEDITMNDEIYAVPNMQMLASQREITIKKDLAEKYKLDIKSIRSTDDIEPFLETIRDNEPDLYPFSTASGLESFQSYDDEKIVDSVIEGIGVSDRFDNKLVLYVSAFTDEYKSKAEKMHEWFNKGYIRDDVLFVNDDNEDRRNGKYAVMTGAYKPGGIEENNARNNYEIIQAVITKPTTRIGSAKMTMTGIYSKSKNPEKAFQVIELMNTDKELYNLAAFGIEGVHYNKIAENRIKLTPNSGYLMSPWAVGCQFNAYFVDDQRDDDWELTKELNDDSIKSKLYGFTFDRSNVKTEVMQVINTYKKYFNAISCGALDPNSYWDKYTEEMEDAGIEKVIAEATVQLEEFLKKKYPNVTVEKSKYGAVFTLE